MSRSTEFGALAGNYGALDDCVLEHFDECFTGWGEARLAKEFDRTLEKVRHPFLHMNIYLKGLRVQRWGVLFTSRGCNKTCHFCQTPRFYRKPYQLPIDELERVVWQYKQEGVGQVIVLDENFGHFDDAATEVIDLLHYYGLKWNPLTRVETLHRNYDSWMERGLCGASIGAESLNQDSLDGAKKGNDSNQTRQVLGWMKRDRILSQVFYIIGFEEDTEASIRDNILELKEYRVDSPQIQILTPYPKTILYKNIEDNYGILDHDLSKYDSTNLVWRHPNISPESMAKLLRWSNDQLFDINSSFSTFKKIAFRSLAGLVTPGGSATRSPLWAGNIDLGR